MVQPPAITSADLKTTPVSSYRNEKLMNIVGRSFKGSGQAGGVLLVDVRRTWEEMSCCLGDHTGGRSGLLLAEDCHFGCGHQRDELIISARGVKNGPLTDRREMPVSAPAPAPAHRVGMVT